MMIKLIAQIVILIYLSMKMGRNIYAHILKEKDGKLATSIVASLIAFGVNIAVLYVV